MQSLSTGRLSFSDRRALAGYGLVIVSLHVAGWGICLAYGQSYPALIGLGLAAYLIPVRRCSAADWFAGTCSVGDRRVAPAWGMAGPDCRLVS